MTNWPYLPLIIHFAIFVDKNLAGYLFNVQEEMIHAAIPIGKSVLYKKRSVPVVLIAADLAAAAAGTAHIGHTCTIWIAW